jgi:FKBP-type peptidyl-prolyl cis-trans isomerase
MNLRPHSNRRMSLLLGINLIVLASLNFSYADEKTQAVQTEETSTPATDLPISYFIGVSFGQQLSQNGFVADDFKTEDLIKGLQDGLAGKEPSMTDEQLEETQKAIQGLLMGRRQKLSEAQKKKGLDFLAENKTKEGVVELEGGLQAKVIKEGEGDPPKPADTVKVHYTGKLISGTVFDSSVQRGQPATFRVEQVIKGWQMALQKMKPGAKWMLYIPSDLAYGAQGSPPVIGPNEVLTFEVELLEIQ